MNLQQGLSLAQSDKNIIQTVLHLLPYDKSRVTGDQKSWSAHAICRLVRDYQPLHGPWTVVDGLYGSNAHCWLEWEDMFIIDVAPFGDTDQHTVPLLKDHLRERGVFMPRPLPPDERQAVDEETGRLRQALLDFGGPAA